MADLADVKVAVLATNGVEQIELTEPVRALRAALAQVVEIAPKTGPVQGMNHHQKGDQSTVDHDLASVIADAFDALLLAGGVANPDTLRTDPQPVAFVRHCVEADKPIAAICHGPWTLIEADGLRGYRMTSWPSLRTDLRNAGVHCQDASMVVGRMRVTSRNPNDLPDFRRQVIALFGTARTRRAA